MVSGFRMVFLHRLLRPYNTNTLPAAPKAIVTTVTGMLLFLMMIIKEAGLRVQESATH